MPLVIKDRVKETSTTSGTGPLTLAGAVLGYQSFSVIGDGNSTYYSIVDPVNGTWEVGIGIYTLFGTTLSRSVVLSSSNSGNLVDFAAGVSKDVFCTYPAERAVTQSAPITYTGDFTVASGDTWIINNPEPIATFDPANSSPTVTLSNGDLTAQGTDTVGYPYWYGAISTNSHSTGKKYFEVTQTIFVDYAIEAGLATTSAAIGGPSVNYLGYDAAGWAFQFSQIGSSWLFHNASIDPGINVGSALTSNGDIVGIAVDFDAGKMWFSANGVWVDVGSGAGSPATGANPSYTFTPNTELYAAVSLNLDQAVVTANFGGSPFTYAIPSGFDIWGGTVTLDPVNINALGVLSNGNLTYTWDNLGFYGSAYSTYGRNTGKYYFEVTNTTAGGNGSASYDNWAFNGGIAQTKNIANDIWPGVDADAWGFWNVNDSGLTTDSSIWNNNTPTYLTGVSQVPQGGYLGVAVDFDAGKIWFDANGTWILNGDPATGANPTFTFTPNIISYAAIGAGSDTPYSAATINFGGSAFAGTLPTGFLAWADKGAVAWTEVTLPAASSCIGRTVTIQNYVPQAITSVNTDVVPLGGGTPGNAILGPTPGSWATLVSDGTNWVVMQEST